MALWTFSLQVSSTILEPQKVSITITACVKATEWREGLTVRFHSPPHAVAPPEGGAGAGAAAAAAPPEGKSGWRSRRSLDGLEVLNGNMILKSDFEALQCKDILNRIM